MGETEEMVRKTMISNWLSVLGAPDILIVDKDKRFIGEAFRGFRTLRNITLQTVIPGHHQSLGATERTHAYFRGIIDRIIGNRKSNCSTHNEWKEFPAMTAIRLNSQVQQYDGFTPGRSVLGERQNYRWGRLVIQILQIYESSSRAYNEIAKFGKYDFQIRKSVFMGRF